MEPAPTEEIVIERGANARRYWRDVWQLRGLVLHLTRRDVVVRYKQTFIGVAWALVRPFMSMVVFTLIFGKVAKLPTEGDAPYPLMVYAGLLPWQLFANGVSRGTTTMVGNTMLISRIYFPRVLLLFNVSLVTLIDFLIAFGFLVALMVWFDFFPDWRVLTLPLFILLSMLTALGLTLWLSALNVRYRDFAYLVPYLLQLGMFISPVGFSSTVVPEEWRLLYSLNPMVGVVDGCRWALLGGDATLYMPGLWASVAFAIALVASGLWYFRRYEATFADRL